MFKVNWNQLKKAWSKNTFGCGAFNLKLRDVFNQAPIRTSLVEDNPQNWSHAVSKFRWKDVLFYNSVTVL